jgi:hypothetical protein
MIRGHTDDEAVAQIVTEYLKLSVELLNHGDLRMRVFFVRDDIGARIVDMNEVVLL